MPKCQYCGEKFDSEQKRGVHVSEQHIDTEDTIATHGEKNTKKNIVKEWKN